jgi:hypothetical protein
LANEGYCDCVGIGGKIGNEAEEEVGRSSSSIVGYKLDKLANLDIIWKDGTSTLQLLGLP